MKKITTLVSLALIALGSYAQKSFNCNNCEVAPLAGKGNSPSEKALWDIQFDHAAGALPGRAGAYWTGTEFWISRWSNDSLFTVNNSGTVTASFTIPGISNVRGITGDGTSLYLATNSTTVYKVNPATKTLISTITVPAAARYITYDASLNSGAGGFYIGSFNSAITKCSMTGANLGSIAPGTHGLTGIYGLAYDNISTGGPYLWAYDQGGNGGQIVQLKLPAGTQTGLIHDATVDFPGIAGGLFIAQNIVPGKNTIGGIAQGASLFGYELANPNANDAKMASLDIPKYAVNPSAVQIKGTIKNNGSNTITAMTIKWNDGTNTYTQNLTSLNIQAWQNYNFTHSTSLNITNTNTINVKVWVELAGDQDVTNDTLTTTVTGVAYVPQKRVFGEEATGTWCQWCPRGACFMDQMATDYPSTWVGAAVHNNDPMVVTAWDQGLGAFISGYPSGTVDRVNSDVDPSQFPAEYNVLINKVVPVAVDIKNISYNSVTKVVTFTVEGDFVAALTGNYKINAVITEDGVTGTTSAYNQANAYAGGGNGVMCGFESKPNPVPAAQMVYDHVGRALLDGFGGSSLPGSIPIGIQSKTYNYTVPSGVNVNKIHLVGMILDGSDGSILNCKASSVPTGIKEDINAQFDLNIYPNPSENNTAVTFFLPNSNNVKVEIYNVMGAVVKSQNLGNLNHGNHRVEFNVNDLGNGLYFVNLTAGTRVISKKLTILK